MAMERKVNKNCGYVRNTKKGWQGEINISGVHFSSINCTFWKDDNNKPFIWVQRNKITVFDEKSSSFHEVKPRPKFECYARYTGKRYPNVSYKGNFIFACFNYELEARWENKEEKVLLFFIERTDKQPLIEKLNEITKEAYERTET